MDEAPFVDVCLPVRRRLPHAPPPWLEGAATYLITVCTTPRRLDQLCSSSVANQIRETLEFHQSHGCWHLHACVLMPDHLHLLATVAGVTDLPRVVQQVKRYLARRARVRWQRDFFEHRLRRDEHYSAKLEYLRQNPVRAGLVDRPEEWPYFWMW